MWEARLFFCSSIVRDVGILILSTYTLLSSRPTNPDQSAGGLLWLSLTRPTHHAGHRTSRQGATRCSAQSLVF